MLPEGQSRSAEPGQTKASATAQNIEAAASATDHSESEGKHVTVKEREHQNQRLVNEGIESHQE